MLSSLSQRLENWDQSGGLSAWEEADSSEEGGEGSNIMVVGEIESMSILFVPERARTISHYFLSRALADTSDSDGTGTRTATGRCARVQIAHRPSKGPHNSGL